MTRKLPTGTSGRSDADAEVSPWPSAPGLAATAPRCRKSMKRARCTARGASSSQDERREDKLSTSRRSTRSTARSIPAARSGKLRLRARQRCDRLVLPRASPGGWREVPIANKRFTKEQQEPESVSYTAEFSAPFSATRDSARRFHPTRRADSWSAIGSYESLLPETLNRRQAFISLTTCRSARVLETHRPDRPHRRLPQYRVHLKIMAPGVVMKSYKAK